MEIKNKYGYVRAQESNASTEFQKQQLIQNGIEEKNICVEVNSAINEIKNRHINQKLKKNDLLMVIRIKICS